VPTINSFIRFLYASSGAPAVDIYTDGNLVLQNLAYNEISEYLPVGSGDMSIQVFTAGEDSNPLIDTKLELPPDERITVAVTGILPDVSLLPLLLNLQPTESEDGLIRLVHLSPTASHLNLSIEDGPDLFNDAEYTQATDFKTIVPGAYNLQLRSAGEDGILLTEPLEVMKRKAYTVYALGLPEAEPPLKISYYQDQIPFIADKIKETEFRKKTVAGNNLQINFIYSR
jgi:hypothetical protein